MDSSESINQDHFRQQAQSLNAAHQNIDNILQ